MSMVSMAASVRFPFGHQNMLTGCQIRFLPQNAFFATSNCRMGGSGPEQAKFFYPGQAEFVVPFPSKVELQRMVAMEYVHTADREGIMCIQELDQKIKLVQHLQKAWFNVYEVPFEIRSFLPLWAVGTIIGATQKLI